MKKMANYGDDGAMLKLGLMYEAGKGVPKDKVMAYKWLSIAASDYNDDESPDGLKAALARVSGTMTSAERAEGRKQAKDWEAGYKPPLPIISPVEL